MKKYTGNALANSTWITHTPTVATASLPFLVAESGHFYCTSDYSVYRDFHDSFLLMYTLNGSGRIQSSETVINLPANTAVIIDCHKFHSYCSASPVWEFVWFHIKGSGTESIHKIIYPEQISAITIPNSKEISSLEELSAKSTQTDILTSVELSLQLHTVLNSFIESRLNNEDKKNNGRYANLVNMATALIEEKYSEPLSIDDIITNIPLSKYHFIRIFKQIMGVTPYHYLTNYRINTAKILLRSEDISIGEVAERCGFSDTSNFICQFKKHTGQKPLEYKKAFSMLQPPRSPNLGG